MGRMTPKCSQNHNICVRSSRSALSECVVDDVQVQNYVKHAPHTIVHVSSVQERGDTKKRDQAKHGIENEIPLPTCFQSNSTSHKLV